MDNEMIDNFSNNLNLNEVSSFIDSVKKEISSVLVGQDEMVELLLAGLLTHGHVLIEGVPGMAKTLFPAAQRQRQCKFRALTSSIAHAHAPAMPLGNLVHNGKAKPCPRRFCGKIRGKY